MNERIRELAEQAGITTNLDTDYFEQDPNKWVDYFAEKFAELIVRECIQVAGPEDSYADDWCKAKIDAVAKIKEHFGVE